MNVLTLLAALSAQQPQLPPIRPIGPIEHVSRDSLTAVTQAVATSGGRVFVNDIVARRVLLYDSTLNTARVVLDTTSNVATAYGAGPANLLRYQGDSALVISGTTRTMLVLTPQGVIARAMALPPAAGGLTTPYASSGFDGHGRMVFAVQARAAPGSPSMGPLKTEATPGKSQAVSQPDSGFVVRFDLATRKLDTITSFRGPPVRIAFNRNETGRITSITMTLHPAPSVDDWNLVSDGAVAVVRGRDYHVEWFTGSGGPQTGPRMAFGWEHLGDEQKHALLDSAVAAMQHTVDSALDANTAKAGASGRGGAGDAAPFRQVVEGVEATTLPDYRPPFRFGNAVRADADGNLWILTTLSSDRRPVYDIVNRKGEVADRVVLPNNRQVAGFGPGVVYMAVLDSLKVAHLERARIR